MNDVDQVSTTWQDLLNLHLCLFTWKCRWYVLVRYTWVGSLLTRSCSGLLCT